MLKFTYTETGLYLEHLTQSLEEWLALRVVLSLRSSQSLLMEHCTAAFLLRSDLVKLHRFETAVSGTGTVSPSDADYVEVSLKGTWVTSQIGQAEGVFVTALENRTEFLIFKLWQESQACASSLGR